VPQSKDLRLHLALLSPVFSIKKKRHFDRSGPQFHRGPRSGEICFSTTPVLSPQSAFAFAFAVACFSPHHQKKSTRSKRLTVSS